MDSATDVPGDKLATLLDMPMPLQRIVCGPVRSRRLGRLLGIHLLPAGMKGDVRHRGDASDRQFDRRHGDGLPDALELVHATTVHIYTLDRRPRWQ